MKLLIPNHALGAFGSRVQLWNVLAQGTKAKYHLLVKHTGPATASVNLYPDRQGRVQLLDNSESLINSDFVRSKGIHRQSSQKQLISKAQISQLNGMEWQRQIFSKRALKDVNNTCFFYGIWKMRPASVECAQYLGRPSFSTSSNMKEKQQNTSSTTRSEDDGIGPKKDWRALLTVPNFLTVTRMVLTPYLGYLVLLESFQLACGVFLFAGVTDLLDGWIARRFPGQSSPVGSFLDPLADKFLVSTLFITLSMVNLIPVPLTVLVVARDVSLIAAAFYVRVISLPSPVTFSAVFNISHQTAELKPTFISKLNTAVQLGLVVTTLGAPVFNFVDHPALHVLWYATAATTFFSGIGYVFAKGTFRLLKQRKQRTK